MKNKVKLWGIIMLVLITLFCFTFTACNNDDDGNGNGTPGNGTPGNGTPGPGQQTLTGNVTITPTTADIGTTLQAQYSGPEEITNWQWRLNGGNIAGQTSSYYLIPEGGYGTYSVLAWRDGYNQKASNNVTVNAPSVGPSEPVPPLTPNSRLELLTAPINFGSKVFGGALGVDGIPLAMDITIRNKTSETVTGVRISVGATSYYNVGFWNPGDRNIPVLQKEYPELGNPNYATGFTLTPRGTTGDTMKFAIQPNQMANQKADVHHDMVTIRTNRGEDMVTLNVVFSLAKAEGAKVDKDYITVTRALSPVVTASSGTSGLDTITINTNGDAVSLLNDQTLEYAIARVDNHTVKPLPGNISKWAKNGQTLDYSTTTGTGTGVGTLTGTISTGDDEVVFTGLIPNNHYMIYVRYGDGTNYKEGDVFNDLSADKLSYLGPLAVSTINP